MKRTIFYLSMVAFIILFACKKDPVVKTSSSSTTLPTVTDIDGNIYHEITIGTQTWMLENLKVTRYRNGDSIPEINADNVWNQLTSGAYCDYNNLPGNGVIYGHLYNWHAVGDTRNICPTGWHIPSRTEWTTLTDFLGGGNNAGGKLREMGLSHWLSPNTGATNQSGFTALPGGTRANIFSDMGNGAYWWTSTDWSSAGAYNWSVSNNSNSIGWNSYHKTFGFSLRCIKD